MKRIGIVLLLLVAALWSCEWETIVPKEVELGDDPISYADQIAPIWVDAGCAGCHGSAGGLDLSLDKSYAGITNGRVDVENPAESKLVKYIDAGHATSGNLTAEQKAMILKWIEQGAKDN